MDPFKIGLGNILKDFAGSEDVRTYYHKESTAIKKKPRLPPSVEFPLGQVALTRNLCRRQKIGKENTVCLPRNLLALSETNEEMTLFEYIHATFFKDDEEEEKKRKRDRKNLRRQMLLVPAEVSDFENLCGNPSPRDSSEIVMSPAEEEAMDTSNP